jgi:hypothetical protein
MERKGSRGCFRYKLPNTVADTSLGGIRVVRKLKHLGFERCAPRVIVSDNDAGTSQLRSLALGHRPSGLALHRNGPSCR